MKNIVKAAIFIAVIFSFNGLNSSVQAKPLSGATALEMHHKPWHKMKANRGKHKGWTKGKHKGWRYSAFQMI